MCPTDNQSFQKVFVSPLDKLKSGCYLRRIHNVQYEVGGKHHSHCFPYAIKRMVDHNLINHQSTSLCCKCITYNYKIDLLNRRGNRA